MTLDRIVVVGGSVAGLSAVEALRKEGYGGRLTLIGEERHLPYDRPPLSKQLLSGKWPVEQVNLRASTHYDSLDLDLRLGRKATRLEQGQCAISLDDGSEVGYDKLIIATGVHARRLPFGHNLQGVHTLRTLDDCQRIGAELLDHKTLVVIGAGFLGTEVAATARGLGCSVTLVAPEPSPIANLGVILGDRLARLHEEKGIRLCFNAKPVSFDSHGGRISQVRLDTGEILPASVVVVAIGSLPTVDWLSDSGLSLDDGIGCDKFLRASAKISAIGDVSRWYHPQLQTHLRLEHRMNAVEQGISVAQDLVHGHVEFQPVPFFWTDQYDVKIQAYGRFPRNSMVKIVEGEPKGPSFVATYESEGKLAGVLGWNAFKPLQRWRVLLKESLESSIATSDLQN